MKYKLNRLDGRHSYQQLFELYLSFDRSVLPGQGIDCFNQAQFWFVSTYGWSAEVRDYAKKLRWHEQSMVFGVKGASASGKTAVPDYCNPHWSWSNIMGNELRIYLASGQELAFFRLAHAVDQ
jgi:hypothetical protein